PSEARDQAFFHARDFLRIGVAGDDDLFARLHQRVERVEKLLLGAPLVGKKLDVVDQQQVERMVVAFEFIKGFLLVSAYYVGNILLRMAIPDTRLRRLVGQVLADGLPRVRLSKRRAVVAQ